MKALVLALLVACTASGRQKVIATTFASTNAASAAFHAFNKQHELDLVAHAPDRASADAALAAWKATSDDVALGFNAAYKAIAVAAQLDNDQSFASMLQAAGIVYGELKALGVKGLP